LNKSEAYQYCIFVFLIGWALSAMVGLLIFLVFDRKISANEAMLWSSLGGIVSGLVSVYMWRNWMAGASPQE
jgi:uncharacterized membrane protein